MTTETVLVSTDWDPESPITTTLAGAWSQNWIAGFEGNSTKKVQTGAIADDAVTVPKIASPTAGTTHLLMRLLDEDLSPSATSYPSISKYLANDPNAHLSCRVINAGTITVYAQHRAITSSGTPTQSLRVLKNGALVQEWTTISLTFVTRTVAVTVAVGDIISVQYKYLGTTGRVTNVRIYSDTETLAVV